MFYNYFIWNNISSLEYGWIKETPFPSSSTQNFEYTAIPKTDMLLVVNKFTRNKISLSFELQLKDRQKYNYVYAWLNGANKQGKLIISDDLNKFYYATCSSIKPKYQKYNISTLTITFDCQPFRYNINDELISLSTNSSINVGGNYYSEPKIKAVGSGSGNIVINNTTLQLYNIDGYYIVDSEKKVVYKDNTIYLNQTIGTLPIFQVGNNSVSFDGGITSLEIWKNERWL